MQTEKLIQTLLEQTRQVLNQVEKLKSYNLLALTWKESPTSWNILECLEHLNLYGDFYLPEIETKIKNSTTPSEFEFKSGILGGFFCKKYVAKRKAKQDENL